MADVKISAGADPGTLTATDKVPVARSASTTAYAATMAELATYANGAYTPNYFVGTPSMDGTGAAGTLAFVSRGDHVHPSDTTKAPLGAQNNIGRNRLHNSGFSINQRSYTSGTALAAAAYGHDRWKAGSGGCTYTFTQTQPFTTITITAGSLQQIVEAMNVEGGTYTLSWTGTAQGRVNAGSYAASPVTVTGLTVNTAITVEFNTGTLGRIQLEVGSVATSPEKPDPRYDLSNCQRFYQVGTALQWGYSNAGQAFGFGITLPVIMRTTPTVVNGANSSTNLTSPSASGITPGVVVATGAATVAGACVLNLAFTASADL